MLIVLTHSALHTRGDKELEGEEGQSIMPSNIDDEEELVSIGDSNKNNNDNDADNCEYEDIKVEKAEKRKFKLDVEI